MMKKVIIILSAFALVVVSYGQTTEKKQAEETEIILVEPILPTLEDDGWELDVPQKTMKSKKIIIEVIDTIPIGANIFYYSPRMENKDYPYWQELGNQNNHLGTTDFDNREQIQIPDTCELGAKLIISAIGYEPLTIDINDIKENYISVRLIPKIYNCTVVLEKRKYQFNPRRTFIKPIIKDEYEKQARIFYGNCSPIYSKNRTYHADPMCAFTCLHCFPKLWLVEIEDYSLKEIYRELKKRKNCSALLYIKNEMRPIEKVEIEGFSKKKKQDNVQQDMQNSEWRFHPIGTRNSFQCRVHFVLQ